MKQFNLKEYIKDPSKKVITRDGRSVRIVCTDRADDRSYPIVGLITCKDEKGNTYESIYVYTINGKVSKDDVSNSDLFFASEKREGWISIYRTESGRLIPGSSVKETEKLSRDETMPSSFVRIAVVKIEWEE